MSTRRSARGSRPSSRSSTPSSAKPRANGAAVSAERPLSLTIEGLAHGGEGVGRDGGRAVFVAGTVPGDRVEAAVVDRGRFARGRLLKVLDPSPLRVPMPCRHAAACGGCQWQQVAAEGQRAAKQSALREALVRVGGLNRAELPEIAVVAGAPFRYRRRARLSVAPNGALGFVDQTGHGVVAIAECWQLTPRLAQLALSASALLRGQPLRPSAVEICATGESTALWLRFERHVLPEALRALAERMHAELGLRGLVVESPLGKFELGAPALPETNEPGARYLRPDVFAQANPEINERLVAAALAALELQGGQTVLELFAGNGNFTLPLARSGAAITAVEREGGSLSSLRRSLAEGGLENVEPVAGDAVPIVDALAREGRRFDWVLLDPPRTGAKELLAPLAALGAPRIVYVACDPATLARDVRVLGGHGYRLSAATVFDQFPQTYHLEALVVLER